MVEIRYFCVHIVKRLYLFTLTVVRILEIWTQNRIVAKTWLFQNTYRISAAIKCSRLGRKTFSLSLVVDYFSIDTRCTNSTTSPGSYINLHKIDVCEGKEWRKNPYGDRFKSTKQSNGHRWVKWFLFHSQFVETWLHSDLKFSVTDLSHYYSCLRIRRHPYSPSETTVRCPSGIPQKRT